MKVTALKTLWETKYCNVDPQVLEWTDEMELELQRLKAGEISSLADTDIIREAIKTENDFLRIKLQTISQSRQINVIKTFLNSLPLEQLEVVTREIACNPGNPVAVNLPHEGFPGSDDLQGETLEESQGEPSSTRCEGKSESDEVTKGDAEGDAVSKFQESSTMDEGDSFSRRSMQVPRQTTSNMEDDIVIKIAALEDKLAVDQQEMLEFKRKLEMATVRMRDGNYNEDDLVVLIQSRGETPTATRARQLSKQWKTAQSKPETWKDDWNATKQVLKELRSQLKFTGSTHGQGANPFHITVVPTLNAIPDNVATVADETRNVEGSDFEEDESEEEEFYVCCANRFCVLDGQMIYNINEAHECSICEQRCHIDCATEVKDAVDESPAIACKECHANFYCGLTD